MQLRQAAALDELHAEIVLALVLADFVDRHDVADDRGWPPPRPRCGSAARRACEASWPARIILRATTRLRLTCRALIDDAHAAASDLLQQLVVAEVADLRAGRRHCCFRRGQRGRLGRRRAPRRGHLILVHEEGGQFGRKFGMFPQYGVTVWRQSRVHRL